MEGRHRGLFFGEHKYQSLLSTDQLTNLDLNLKSYFWDLVDQELRVKFNQYDKPCKLQFIFSTNRRRCS